MVLICHRSPGNFRCKLKHLYNSKPNKYLFHLVTTKKNTKMQKNNTLIIIIEGKQAKTSHSYIILLSSCFCQNIFIEVSLTYDLINIFFLLLF